MIINVPTVVRGYHIQLVVKELKGGQMAVLRRNDYLSSVPRPSWILYDFPPSEWNHFRFLFKLGDFGRLLSLIENQRVLKMERQKARSKRISKDNPKVRTKRHKPKKKFKRPADTEEFQEKRKQFLKSLGLSSRVLTDYKMSEEAKLRKISSTYVIDEFYDEKSKSLKEQGLLAKQ